MYDFLRNEPRIPFIRNDSISTPQDTIESETSFFDEGLTHYGKGMTMGDVITEVYRAQRSGKLYGVVVECLKEAGLGRTGLENGSPTLIVKQDAGGANGNLKRLRVEGEGGVADEHGVEVRERAGKRRKSMRAWWKCRACSSYLAK
jgi:phenylalanine ammonia-lyase